MNLAMQLRLKRNCIAHTGILRFEEPEGTVYAASQGEFLLRQQQGMALLRHLEVAPQPGLVRRERRLWVMEAQHPPLHDFLTALAESKRRDKIELIRRLGAAMGMVHSLRHTGTGDILHPAPVPVAVRLTALARKSLVLLAARGNKNGSQSGLLLKIRSLWGDASGTLVGNWPIFPAARIWASGLMFMDFSRACYSEQLLDLVSLHPRDVGLETMFFWEYFLQGYGATCELPEQGREKIGVLYHLMLLQALATGREVQRAQADCRSGWWNKV